ncbi:MAG: hypothetical protein GQ535_00260 [Rhodobacteraceae bacterium]|nr:hypothetical protein [Paracoccaceae bacterium]
MGSPIKTRVFALSGLLPIAYLALNGTDTMLLGYSLFVATWLLNKGEGRALFGFVLLYWGAGLVTEVLAWLSDYLAGAPFPTTFHPQLLPDLIIALGFYGGMAVAWGLVLWRFRFSLLAVFITGGIYGVAIEQDGAVLMMVLTILSENPLAGLILAAYVFVVYGSVPALAFTPFRRRLSDTARAGHWIKYPLVLAGLYLFSNIGVWLIIAATEVLGGLPLPRSAQLFPLW